MFNIKQFILTLVRTVDTYRANFIKQTSRVIGISTKCLFSYPAHAVGTLLQSGLLERNFLQLFREGRVLKTKGRITLRALRNISDRLPKGL